MSRVAILATVSITLSLLIVGCAATKTEKQADSAQRDLFLQRGMSFYWGERVFLDAPRFAKANVEAKIESEVISQLLEKGLVFEETGESVQLLVSYAVYLGDYIRPDEVPKLYSDEPLLKEIGPESESFEKGKFSLEIRDAASKQIVWRNAIEGFASIETETTLRDRRIVVLVRDLLFSTFPPLIEE